MISAATHMSQEDLWTLGPGQLHMFPADTQEIDPADLGR